MATLSVAYIVRDEMSFLPQSLEQAEKIADEIVVVVDDRSNDGTWEFLSQKALDAGSVWDGGETSRGRWIGSKYRIIERKWDQGAIQKDFALQQCMKDWVLFLDGDEVLSDNCGLIKEAIEKYNHDPEVDGFDLYGHHFIYNLALEDFTAQNHVWEARLFKRTDKVYISGKNHAITMGLKEQLEVPEILKDVRILHYGYVKGLQKIMDKFNEDLEIRQFHKLNFLYRWKDWHLLGKIPLKPFRDRHPQNILKKFKLEYVDEFGYFANRDKMEVKFFVDAHYFIKHFDPKTVLDIGCGMGQRIMALRLMNVNALGCDISRVAVSNSPFGIDDFLHVWDVTEGKCPVNELADLVIAYDLLEHIPLEKLDVALENIKATGKKFVFSICLKGDPNYPLDSTHKIEMSRQWWEAKLQEKGFALLKVPADMPYAHQLVVCEAIR